MKVVITVVSLLTFKYRNKYVIKCDSDQVDVKKRFLPLITIQTGQDCYHG